MVSLIWDLQCEAWCDFLPVDGRPFGGFPSGWGSVQWGKERELWSHKDFGFGSTTFLLAVGRTWVGHSTFLNPGSLSKSDISLCHAVAIKMKCDSVCKQCGTGMAWEFTSFWPLRPALCHPSPSTSTPKRLDSIITSRRLGWHSPIPFHDFLYMSQSVLCPISPEKLQLSHEWSFKNTG